MRRRPVGRAAPCHTTDGATRYVERPEPWRGEESARYSDRPRPNLSTRTRAGQRTGRGGTSPTRRGNAGEVRTCAGARKLATPRSNNGVRIRRITPLTGEGSAGGAIVSARRPPRRRPVVPRRGTVDRPQGRPVAGPAGAAGTARDDSSTVGPWPAGRRLWGRCPATSLWLSRNSPSVNSTPHLVPADPSAIHHGQTCSTSTVQ